MTDEVLDSAEQQKSNLKTALVEILNVFLLRKMEKCNQNAEKSCALSVHRIKAYVPGL